MASLTVTNKGTVNAPVTLKLRDGMEMAAPQVARKDGADNVFFTAGRDTYVSSGRGMDLSKLKVGDEVRFHGQKGKIILLDEETNTAADGVRAVAKSVDVGTKVTAFGGAVGGIVMAGSWASGLGAFGAAVAAPAVAAGAAVGGGVGLLAAGAVGAAVTGVSAARGANRKVDLDALRSLAE